MVVGKRCAAYFKGGWLVGTIVKHDVKYGYCTVETKGKYGTIKVKIYRIRMLGKEYE